MDKIYKNKAIIFDIQKFSIHDGPGIRTLIFFKGCPLGCLWCSNPESQTINKEMVYFEDKCFHCNKCIAICETGALTLKNDKINLNNEICSFCGKCVEVCPPEARKIYGDLVDIPYLMNEIKKDYLFYINSGGGVTLGGGEPLIWGDFVSRLSKECKKEKIHVAIETAGLVPWKNINKVLPYCDLILFDLKHMNSTEHEKICGKPNNLILNNLKALSEEENIELIIRIPVIPGYNDSDQNITSLAKFVSSLNGRINRVDLLPYFKHHLKKYQYLGRRYPLDDIKVPSEEQLEEIKEIIQKHKVNVQICG